MLVSPAHRTKKGVGPPNILLYESCAHVPTSCTDTASSIGGCLLKLFFEYIISLSCSLALLLSTGMCMSADPYLRSGCKSEEKGGAIPRPMAGFVSGKIVASKREGWAAGDLFGASLDFTTVQLITVSLFNRR